MLYDSFIARDLDAIPAAVREYRASHTAEELWESVTRFAVLAYAPSQHGKSALLACLAAWELRDQLAGTFDEVLLECARYTAESRLPWSEPPIFDPPPVERSHPREIEELRAAIAAHDRLRAEQWLAARLNDADLARDLLRVAADDRSNGGDALIVTVAAWKLAALLGEKGRFVALRVAMWELTSGGGDSGDVAGTSESEESVLRRLIEQLVAVRGDVLAAQALFLFDAAVEASAISGDATIADRVRAHLSATTPAAAPPGQPLAAAAAPPAYRLARDYGTFLRAHALANRLAGRYPSIDASRIVAAAGHNLAHGSSFEDFTFA